MANAQIIEKIESVGSILINILSKIPLKLELEPFRETLQDMSIYPAFIIKGVSTKSAVEVVIIQKPIEDTILSSTSVYLIRKYFNLSSPVSITKAIVIYNDIWHLLDGNNSFKISSIIDQANLLERSSMEILTEFFMAISLGSNNDLEDSEDIWKDGWKDWNLK